MFFITSNHDYINVGQKSGYMWKILGHISVWFIYVCFESGVQGCVEAGRRTDGGSLLFLTTHWLPRLHTVILWRLSSVIFFHLIPPLNVCLSHTDASLTYFVLCSEHWGLQCMCEGDDRLFYHSTRISTISFKWAFTLCFKCKLAAAAAAHSPFFQEKTVPSAMDTPWREAWGPVWRASVPIW